MFPRKFNLRARFTQTLLSNCTFRKPLLLNAFKKRGRRTAFDVGGEEDAAAVFFDDVSFDDFVHRTIGAFDMYVGFKFCEPLLWC